MPELPEVETITRQLNKTVKGLKIKSVWFDWPKLFKGVINAKNFASKIKNLIILGIRRRGKNILIDFTNGNTCLIHLKLTGRILVGDNGFVKQDPYIHLKMQLNNKKFLALSDLRKFAKIILDKRETIENLPEIKTLGPDPLTKKFNFEIFQSLLRKKKKGEIKTILMDQSVISGIGNIYANEILWEAGLNPFKDIKKLSLKEEKGIYRSIRKILMRAVKYRGATIADVMYRDIKGKPGEYGKIAKVYQRAGKKCLKCGTSIKRAIQKNRATFYCPKCQKLKSFVCEGEPRQRRGES